MTESHRTVFSDDFDDFIQQKSTIVDTPCIDVDDSTFEHYALLNILYSVPADS
jgi:hypothetical protein